MKRTPPNIIGIILIIAAFSSFLYTLSLTGPTWSPLLPTTNDTLQCSWTNSTDTIAQNITILKNGAVFNWTYENASLMLLNNSRSIAASDTAKNEVWTCRITLYNGTANTTQEINVTIQNAAPETPIVYNNLSQDIGTQYTVLEDTVYGFDVNSSDKDSDTLTYYFKAATTGFCTMTNGVTGIASCAPTNSYITGNAPTLLNITFWVDDDDATFAKSSSRTVQFNITPVNDAPVLSLANQTTPVNQSLNYTFSATDEESSFPLAYVLYAPAEISNKLALSMLNANGTSMSLYYNGTNPDFNDIGLWNVTINVTDNSSTLGTNDSRSVNFTLVLNISAVGRYPYFTAISANKSNSSGVYQLSQGESIQINISTNDPDANSTHMFLDNTTYFNIGTLKADTNTSDAIGQINYTPLNAEVGIFSVLVTARDAESLENTTVLQFNVTNVNDAPSVNQNSTSSSNTQSNVDMNNITAFANTPFVYDVNATDPDTIHGDTLTYSDNTTLFNISSTGRISFTPNDAQVGSYYINISVADAGGLQANRTMNLTIRANTPPYFNATLTQLNCTTNANCLRSLDAFTADPDGGDSIAIYNITFTSGTLGSFNYSNTSGTINFTPGKTEVANYTVNVTITDTHGASNWSLMNISINNTPVAPNLTRYNFSNETIVETHQFTYELQATDEDLLVTSAGEAITFTTNLSISHTITNISPSGSTARALLEFTPSLGQAGNYSIMINATDRFGLKSQWNITIQIYPDVPPPNITNITPWGTDDSSHTIQTTWINTSVSQFSDNQAEVALNENTTVLFNVTAVDTRPLTYAWNVDGTQVAATQHYSRAFDFFSNGTYNVTVNVSNDRLEWSLFTWLLTVANVNRPPVLNGSGLQTPLVVNGTEGFNDYFTGASGQKYYDADDDLDSDGRVLTPEENTLVFSTTSTCSVATLTISGRDLTVTGRSIGTCDVQFLATDLGGEVLGSNLVTINITDIENGTETETPTTSSGGGGGGGTTFIPISRDQEKPQAFSLIAPKLVTIYNNRSLQIPIVLNNTWNGSLKLVRISAEVNATGVNASFDTDFFEEIPEGEMREVMLTITNYRMGGNYEAKVIANVSDPQYDDQALILLNSIEQSADGADYNVKVTFANDLVNEHPECQELNEVLELAKERVAAGDLEQGRQLVESVISGCKYLVSTQQNIEERPGRINPVINIDNLSVKAIMLGVLFFVVISSCAFLIYYHYSHKPEDDI